MKIGRIEDEGGPDIKPGHEGGDPIFRRQNSPPVALRNQSEQRRENQAQAEIGLDGGGEPAAQTGENY